MLIVIALLAVAGILGYVSWEEHGTSVPPYASSTPASIATTTHIASSGTPPTTVGRPAPTPAARMPSLDALLALGLKNKQAGDYAGAAAAWQRASALYPANIVSFNNLGDLYMNFLPNYPAAESNYLREITNLPVDINAYRALFELYTYHYKQGTPAAEDILKKGAAANPKAYDLQVLLARYYRDSGRTANARAMYEAAAANARAQGLTELAAQIQQEESSF